MTDTHTPNTGVGAATSDHPTQPLSHSVSSASSPVSEAPSAKKTARPVSPIRKITSELDATVRRIEANKLQIKKLAKLIESDVKKMDDLMQKLVAERNAKIKGG